MRKSREIIGTFLLSLVEYLKVGILLDFGNFLHAQFKLIFTKKKPNYKYLSSYELPTVPFETFKKLLETSYNDKIGSELHYLKIIIDLASCTQTKASRISSNVQEGQGRDSQVWRMDNDCGCICLTMEKDMRGNGEVASLNQQGVNGLVRLK